MIKIISILFAILVATSCGKGNKSELMGAAVPNDPNVRVIKLLDGSEVKFILISRKKAYELTCDDPQGLSNLLVSIGYPDVLINSNPPKRYDELGEDIKIDDKIKIDCNSDEKVLYKSVLGGQTRYFVTDKKGSIELYTIGCQALIQGMGLKLNSAFEIPSYLITETNVFNASDDLDINCSSGIEPNDKTNWKREDTSDLNQSETCDGIEDCVYIQQNVSLWWARRPDKGLTNWGAAVSFCEGLKLSGHDDWRLPTKDEAVKAHHDGVWAELKSVLLDSFPSTWSAAETADAQAWIVNLSNGSGSLKPKTYVTMNATTCVRQKNSQL